MVSTGLLLRMEIALHREDCKAEVCDGHGEKYMRMAQAVAAELPPNEEPFWLRDRKLIQESALNLILDKLDSIEGKVNNNA